MNINFDIPVIDLTAIAGFALWVLTEIKSVRDELMTVRTNDLKHIEAELSGIRRAIFELLLKDKNATKG